ncbi:MAG: hypothetical protein JWP52_1884, partial [Rhizobacter sp.]|nr:hypothetical protein [Rhizobacter sp.]
MSGAADKRMAGQASDWWEKVS